MRKLAQAQLDGMAREGFLTREESLGEPFRTPGVTRGFWGADPERHTLWFHFDLTMGKARHAAIVAGRRCLARDPRRRTVVAGP